MERNFRGCKLNLVFRKGFPWSEHSLILTLSIPVDLQLRLEGGMTEYCWLCEEPQVDTTVAAMLRPVTGILWK